MLLFQITFESFTGLPEWIGYVFVFAFGAAIGSFLNVVIHRVPRELSVVFPNSACPKCSSKIAPYDNLPVISWLILGGKCRKCKEPISWRYPAVEFLTASVFLLVAWALGFGLFLPVGLIFAAVMISLVFIDAEHMILPDVITWPLLGFAVLVRIIYPLIPGYSNTFSDLTFSPLTALETWPMWAVSLTGAVLGGLVGGGSLWLVGQIWERLRGVEAMGLGDVKMMFGVGALLGWRLTILTIFLAAFTGALAGVIVIAKSKDKDMQAQIPFGIFLGIGAVAALLFGDQLIAWYIETFIPR